MPVESLDQRVERPAFQGVEDAAMPLDGNEPALPILADSHDFLELRRQRRQDLDHRLVSGAAHERDMKLEVALGDQIDRNVVEDRCVEAPQAGNVCRRDVGEDRRGEADLDHVAEGLHVYESLALEGNLERCRTQHHVRRQIADHGAPASALDDAVGLEGAQTFTHRIAADAEEFGQVPFGGQGVTGGQPTVADQPAHALGDGIDGR